MQVRVDAARASRIARIALFVILSLLVLYCGAGCRDTDVLKHIRHNQQAEVVDYDSDLKYLINDEDAELTSEQVSATEVDRDASPTEEKQNLVVYSSDPNASRYKAKKSVFSFDPDFNGLEASDGVRLVEQEEDEEAVEQEVADKTNTTDADTSGGKREVDEGNDDSDNKGEGASEGAEDTKPKEDDGGGAGGDVEVVDTTGKYSEPPQVGSIAAFGEAAVIVQMVGGSKALAAADKELLDGKFSDVFAKQGAADIAMGWTGDGAAEGMDADAIVKSGAGAVLVYSSDYNDGLTEEQKATLKKGGVKLVVIPTLSNSTYIKQAVRKVAKMLAKSEAIGNAGKTEGVADAYAAFHDDVVSKCVGANGGKLAGSKIYEDKNDAAGRYSYNADAKYTLMVDFYDASASFTGTFGGSWTPTCDGIGLATYGYAGVPTSFYIQAGGLINNAADKGTANGSGTMPVWQFSANSMSFEKKRWSYGPTGAFAKSDSASGSAWSDVLFTTSRNLAGNGVGSSFGSDDFPVVIVAEPEARNSIVSNSKKANGAYHPYDLVVSEGEGITARAFGKGVDNNICYSSIGVDGATRSSDNLFANGQIDESSIVVNPKGLFSTWTAGSVEAFLEAAWVNDIAQGNSEKVDVRSLTKQFYDQFYGYPLSDTELTAILDRG